MMIRLIIAAPRMLLYDTLRVIFNKRDNFYVVGCASNVEELLHLLAYGNVALIDSKFKGEETAKLIQELHAEHPRIKFVPVGVPDCPSQIVSFVEAGASTYILDNDSADDLVNKVRAVVNGKALVSEEMAAFMMNYINDLATSGNYGSNGKGENIPLLTPRQQEVMRLVIEGLTNKEIAQKLCIQSGTVKNHVHRILKKTGAKNRYEAASIYRKKYANNNGFDLNHTRLDTQRRNVPAEISIGD